MFKNARDGIGKIYISELMMLIAGVMAFIGTVVDMTTVKASGTDPAFYGVFVPVLAIVALIAGLIVYLINLWNTNEDFRNAVINIWNSIIID